MEELGGGSCMKELGGGQGELGVGDRSVCAHSLVWTLFSMY